MDQRIVRSCIAVIVACAAFGQAKLSPADDAMWLDGWKFRTSVTATEAAPSYEVDFQHEGLARNGGSDIRVTNATGEPVSHFVLFADDDRARLLFDGAGGAGNYFIYFGNLAPDLPPLAAGPSLLGRKEWKPQGGYTSIAYAATKDFQHKLLVGMNPLKDYFKRVKLESGAKAQEDPKTAAQFTEELVHRSTEEPLSKLQFRILSGDFIVAQEDDYEFVLGDGRNTYAEAGMLIVDGAYERPVIAGWFSGGGGMALMVNATGRLKLSPGPHKFELYTTRPMGTLRMGSNKRPAGTLPDVLDGRVSHFPGTVKLTAAPLEVHGSSFADATFAVIDERIASGALASARALTTSARQRFAAEPTVLAELDKRHAAAGQAAYERNWQTESKDASRAGAVPTAKFGPPFAMRPENPLQREWDPLHQSSCIWADGELIDGLTLDVQANPWPVTSAIAYQDRVIYVGTKNGEMHAVDLGTRKRKWVFPGGGPCLGAPLIEGGVLYYGALDRRVYALDLERGRMLWNFPTGGWIEGGLCASGGRIFFGSGDGRLYALDAKLGVVRWNVDLKSELASTPATDGRLVYIGSRQGKFTAVDAQSGQLAWTHDAGAEIAGGCAIGHGAVVFGDMSGRVHGLRCDGGAPVWATPCDVGGPVAAAPILVGPVFYGGTVDGKLFGIDAGDGALGWKQEVKASVTRPPLFAADTLIYSFSGTPELRPVIHRYTAGPRPNVACGKAPAPIQVDGKLDEPAWQVCKPLAMVSRNNGLTDDVERCAMRLMWDEQNLYMAVECRDRDLVADPAKADDPWASDHLAVMVTLTGSESPATLVRMFVDGRRSGTVPFADPPPPPSEGQPPSPPDENAPVEVKVRAALQVAGVLRTPAAAAESDDVGWTAELTIPLALLPEGAKGVGKWRVNIVAHDAAPGLAEHTWTLAPSYEARVLPPSEKWPALGFENKAVGP